MRDTVPQAGWYTSIHATTDCDDEQQGDAKGGKLFLIMKVLRNGLIRQFDPDPLFICLDSNENCLPDLEMGAQIRKIL